MSTKNEYPRHAGLWERVASAYQHGDLAHDGGHVMRVYGWALKLAAAESVDGDLAGAAALVHDRIYVPKHHPDRPRAALLSAEAARVDLLATGYDREGTEVVVSAVAGSNWSSGTAAASVLAAVIQDADRLDALGAVGIARTFATAQSMTCAESALFHPSDPLAVGSRPLDDRHFATDHFRVKLLRLADGMHFELSRHEARRRHDIMLRYLDDLGAELTTIF